MGGTVNQWFVQVLVYVSSILGVSPFRSHFQVYKCKWVLVHLMLRVTL